MIDEENQIYVIVDIEADGPVAGLYSMLSIGAVATTSQQEIGRFYRKLLPLESASQDPSTMDWWATQPEAWKEVTEGAEDPDVVMKDFYDWARSFNKSPVFVAHPIAFDYAVVCWYLWKFVGKDPFTNGQGASITLDLSSFIAGKYNLTLNVAKRSKLPAWMTEGMPEHSHNALDDAAGYGVILRNILKRQV